MNRHFSDKNRFEIKSKFHSPAGLGELGVLDVSCIIRLTLIELG